jgi:hypothetical protein
MPESAYVYHDRKMMKWLPFHALLEQDDYVREMLDKRHWIERPVLSPDQEAELNYELEAAWLANRTVQVSYYEHHRIHTVDGPITRIDRTNRLVFIGDVVLSAHQITAIEAQ